MSDTEDSTSEELLGGPETVTDRDRASELGDLMLFARTSYLLAASDWHWRSPRPSQVAADAGVLSAVDTVRDGADGIHSGATLIHEVVVTYLEVAAGHLAGVGTMYRAGEVFFAPLPLVRSVIENCARALWVLGKPTDTAESRLARAYLEEFYSSEVAKRVAGHLGGRPDPIHQAAKARWKKVRARMVTTFPGATSATIAEGELGGEERLGVEACVLWFYELLHTEVGGSVDKSQAGGIYDFLSSGTHPSLYQARQLREYVDHGDHLGTRLVMDIGFLERLTGAALVPYYQVLSGATSYFGGDAAPVEALADAIEKALPGTLT